MKNGWFRFYSETISDRKLQRIARMTQQPLACIIGVWATVLSSANDSRANGDLMMTATEPMTADDMADMLDMDAALVEETVAAFVSMDMIHNIDGRYHVTNWEKRQYVDTTNERVRRWRQKRSETSSDDECNVTETLQTVTCNDPVTHQTTDYRLQTTDKDSAAVAATPADSLPEDVKPKDHPAIAVWRETHDGKYPAKATWPGLIQAVGESPADLARWRQVITAYIGCGWNPANLSGMLDWYTRNETPHAGGNGRSNGRMTQQESKRQENKRYEDYWDEQRRKRGLAA